MAPLRRLLAVPLLAALASLAALAPSTSGAPTASLHGPRGHHATHRGCKRTARTRGRAGSFHATHPVGHGRGRHGGGCLRKGPFHRPHHRSAAGHRQGSHRKQVEPHPPLRGPSGHRRSRSADANGGCEGAQLRPNQEDLDAIRAAILCLVNRERTSRGEGELHGDGHLQEAAQGHSESMAFGNYFEHLGPGGQTPLDRMRQAGYVYSSNIGYEVGENIAWGSGSLGTPAAIVSAWMSSPGHRENILDPRYRDSGVGVSSHLPRSLGGGGAGGIYTQDFGVITTG